MQTVVPTLSPSMDIQVSSNFERLLFELYDQEGDAVERLLEQFRETGTFSITHDRLYDIRKIFRGFSLDDDETRDTIADVYARTGELIDPHTAIGIAAGRAVGPGTGMPVITLATAHPAKFPQAIREATGREPVLPERLAAVLACKERFTVLPVDRAAVKEHIRLRARR